jgi:hypothetical protein
MRKRDVSIKRDARLPSLRKVLSGENIHTATAVEFRMRQVVFGLETPVQRSGAAVIESAATTDQLSVRYDWAAVDTSLAGLWECEFWVTVAGKLFKKPEDSYILVEVLKDAAG